MRNGRPSASVKTRDFVQDLTGALQQLRAERVKFDHPRRMRGAGYLV